MLMIKTMDSKEKYLKLEEKKSNIYSSCKAQRKVQTLIANHMMKEGPLHATNEEGVIFY